MAAVPPREREMMSPKMRMKPRYRRWRTAIRERDNFTCQVCGDKLKIAVVHHLSRHPFGEGITVCKACHSRIHFGVLGLKPVGMGVPEFWGIFA